MSGHSEKVDKARLLSPLHCGSPPFTMRDEHPRSKKRSTCNSLANEGLLLNSH